MRLRNLLALDPRPGARSSTMGMCLLVCLLAPGALAEPRPSDSAAYPYLCNESLVWSRPASPVAHGQKQVLSHPHYASLLRVAQSLGVEVVWSRNVGAIAHIPLREGESLEGYFDDTTNKLFLDMREATLATLVHELRHAVHLGTAHGLVGSGFELTVQRAARAHRRFVQEVGQAEELSPGERRRLISLSETLLTTASELSAHYHDIIILLTRHARVQAEGSEHYRKLYRRKFLAAAHELAGSEFARRHEFFGRFIEATAEYYRWTQSELAASQDR